MIIQALYLAGKPIFPKIYKKKRSNLLPVGMLLVIYNTLAGNRGAQCVVDKLYEKLARMDISYTSIENIHLTPEKVDELFKSGDITHTIISGGDGTVNHALNALKEYLTKIPIGIVPCGYGNLISRSLGTYELEDFLSEKSGYTGSEIKIGQANNRIFLNVASVGLTADTVHIVERFRGTTFGAYIYRVMGGLMTHAFVFFAIQFRKAVFQNHSDYPSSKTWLRTNNHETDNAFSVFLGVRETMGQYKSLYLPKARFIPWSKKCTPATSDKYVIEHEQPFSWQIDGEPQEETRSLTITFKCERLFLCTITIDGC